jgi:predicted amino acid-binding ACT domain protein
VRIRFRDGTGIIRSVGTAFANAGISIQSILQNPIKDKNDAMFVVMTDPADVSQVKAACVELEAQDWCLGNTFYMPVL